MEETSQKKKKGRPSLLDLQQRNLKQQQHPNHATPLTNSAPHSTPNHNYATTSRRSTRRNPNPDEDDKEEEESERKQLREKKSTLNSGSDRSDSAAEGDQNDASTHKRRKINLIGDGSEAPKGQSRVSDANPTSNQQGTPMDLGPSTALPDKKLLLLIIDRLQKKDTYSVFSEPVDPKELPDYHEIIEHPMDFSTVRKKLGSGVYATLKHFEKDIFLICSNAMRYNSPDTIYHRQARSIQDLATKSFENLRQDNEPERRVVRRGRPPTKHLKKRLGRPPLERTGSEFSDEPLATEGENNISANYGIRKGAHSDKSGFAHNADPNWLTQNKFDKNDELSGSMLKGTSMKLGKKLFVVDEKRHHTYKQFHPSARGREPSVLATFNIKRKQLMAVGLHSEQGYARSLALFAASLGPVVWKIASKRIERSLTVGIKFGPGWVGDNDILPQRPLAPPPAPQLSSSQSLSVAATVNSKQVKLPEKHEGDNLSLPTTVANKAPEPVKVKSEGSTGSNGIRPRPPFPVEQGHLIRPGMNGTYGFSLQQDSAPPDLNMRIQSPGSPSCSRVEKMQPDIALQL